MSEEERKQRQREAEKRFYNRFPDKRAEKNRLYWERHKDEINRKRREQYAAKKVKQA